MNTYNLYINEKIVGSKNGEHYPILRAFALCVCEGVLWVEPNALCMLRKSSITELHLSS